MSGSGLAADVIDPVNKPYGRMFIATGNGVYDALSPFTNNEDYGDDHIRLDLTNGILTVQDSFTPSNQASLNGQDLDVAAGGILLLPDQSSGGHQRLLVQVGKEGKIYVVDRDNMGGYSTTSDNNVQEISGQTGGLWSMPAYWNNFVYFWGTSNNLTAFSLTAGKLSTTPVARSSASSSFPGATPSVSSNGTTNGIVWALQTNAFGSSGNAILRAFNATSVGTELFNSTGTQSTTGISNAAGPAVKFAVPTVTNGKVYIGTQREVDVYGLLGASQTAATPVISPASQSFTGTVSVTITDSTSGATIYYTRDGSQPSTSSTKYTGAITVNTTETISAVASATGFLTSAVAKQTYTLQTQTLAPTFNPPGGSYTSAQTVTISDATPNSQIYYTTDGSTPSPGAGTTTLYSGALSIRASTVVNAIATASGLSQSPLASATYTINIGGTGINFSTGFSASASSMTFNGSTGLNDTRLQLTSGGTYQAGSAWYNSQVNIQAFSTDFAFQLANPAADGMTFTIQGMGLTALGPAGGGLGYGPDSPTGATGTSIGKSVAIKFDLYSNAGEGANSTGMYTNGASPTTPAIDLTPSGIDLHSGDTLNVHLAYDGSVLSLTINDTVANKSFSTSWTVNIPSIVGGNTAYVGFTGGTGGLSSSQKVETWTFTSTGSTPTAATPTISPASGTYTLPLTVTLADSTSGASVYYTTDGSTPTTASTLYSAPLALSGPATIKAIASAPSHNSSPVASNTYSIRAATPIFSPGAGTYTSSQSVTITDTTPNSTIYYTLDGTTPTTASSLYSGPVFIGTTQTLTAIAVAPGLVNSQPLAGLYTINSSGGTGINFGTGFSSGSMTLVSAAGLNGSSLRITDGGANEVAAAWYPSPVNIQAFTTDFTFLVTPGTSPTADGFAFVIQGVGTSAIGPFGGGLGYGPATVGGTGGIGSSIAVKFDLYSNNGEGADSTGLYTNGASPTTPFVDMTGSAIDLHSGHPFKVHMTYDGTNLTMTVTDATTNGAFAKTWAVNIPGAVGGNAAFVGFTGGTGTLTAIQDIQTWTFSSGTTQSQAATPTFTPPGSTYSSAQNVTISSTTSGATIYYTTNGSTPSTASTKYTGPVSVGTSETLNAIAVATGFTNSNVGTASYTISSGSGPSINFGSEFTATGLSLNGSAALNGTRLRLTSSGTNQAGSAWFSTPVSINSFTTDFTFQLSSIGTSAFGNGITFVVQNTGTTAVGPSGGGLGYGPDNVTNPSGSPNSPIGKSVAVKFDIVSNAGEGTNSTGLYQNGASPTMPAITPTGGVNLRSGDTFKAHITYDGTTLTLTLTDQVNTSQTFTTSWAVNIPSVIGGTTAYVGFAGGTGSSVANQDIVTWTLSNGATGSKTPIVYATASLPAVSSGPTFRQFSDVVFPDGTGTIIDATKVGDNVTFTVNVPTVGIYDVKLSYKTINTRGISQLSINGKNVGATFDEYLAAATLGTVDFGTYNFATTGNYSFQFTVTGKNASSSGYTVSFDDITLTPQ
jgi:Legume lectin domain/Chitobiase/beta-hexosaminidase C-terminal domain